MPEYTADELRILAGDDFNNYLRADPVIAALQAQKYSRADEEAVLLDALEMNGNLAIGKLPVRPLTAAKWAFLWLMKSPFICGGKPTLADIGLMLYVLSRRDLRADVKTTLAGIPAEAVCYFPATGESLENVLSAIQMTTRRALLPLMMLPRDGEPAAEIQYDLDWLTRICGVAARESGERFTQTVHDMPLSQVCALYVDWRRRECAGGDQIRRRPDTETMDAIDKRMDQLAEEFLKNVNKTDA